MSPPSERHRLHRYNRGSSSSNRRVISASIASWNDEQRILQGMLVVVAIGAAMVNLLLYPPQQQPFFQSSPSAGPVTFAAAYDFGCHNVWDGAAASNDVTSCLMGWPFRDPGMLTPPVLPLLLTALLLVLFPLSFVCRCLGACGSNEARPGAECCCDGEEWDELPDKQKLPLYPDKHVRLVKCAGFLTFLLSLLCVGMVAYGFELLTASAADFLTAARVQLLDWAMNLLNTIEVGARREDGTFISPLTNTTFDPFRTLHSWADGIISDWDATYKRNIETAKTSIFIASAAPAASFLFMLFMIVCNIRRCMPACFQCIYFFLGTLCGILGVVFLLVGIMGTCLCGELNLHQWKAPGIFQWSIVPTCERNSIFSNVSSMLRSMEVQNSQSACREALATCNADATFNVTDPNRLFVCTFTDATIPRTCADFSTTASLIKGMPFKAGTAALCPGCSTFADCATGCTTPAIRASAAETVRLMNFATNASTLIDMVIPIVDCDALATRFISPLKGCDSFSFGMLAVGCGAGLACLLYIWAIVILCKGQKIFFNRDSVIDSHEEAADGADAMGRPQKRRQQLDDEEDEKYFGKRTEASRRYERDDDADDRKQKKGGSLNDSQRRKSRKSNNSDSDDDDQDGPHGFRGGSFTTGRKKSLAGSNNEEGSLLGSSQSGRQRLQQRNNSWFDDGDKFAALPLSATGSRSNVNSAGGLSNSFFGFTPAGIQRGQSSNSVRAGSAVSFSPGAGDIFTPKAGSEGQTPAQRRASLAAANSQLQLQQQGMAQSPTASAASPFSSSAADPASPIAQGDGPQRVSYSSMSMSQLKASQRRQSATEMQDTIGSSPLNGSGGKGSNKGGGGGGGSSAKNPHHEDPSSPSAAAAPSQPAPSFSQMPLGMVKRAKALVAEREERPTFQAAASAAPAVTQPQQPTSGKARGGDDRGSSRALFSPTDDDDAMLNGTYDDDGDGDGLQNNHSIVMDFDA